MLICPPLASWNTDDDAPTSYSSGQNDSWTLVGCRPDQEQRLFLEEKHARGKR